MLLEPLQALPVVWQHPLHLGPEPGRVVHLQPVAQLVNHHIVDDMVGGEHQQAVEIQVAL